MLDSVFKEFNISKIYGCIAFENLCSRTLQNLKENILWLKKICIIFFKYMSNL